MIAWLLSPAITACIEICFHLKIKPSRRCPVWKDFKPIPGPRGAGHSCTHSVWIWLFVRHRRPCGTDLFFSVCCLWGNTFACSHCITGHYYAYEPTKSPRTHVVYCNFELILNYCTWAQVLLWYIILYISTSLLLNGWSMPIALNLLFDFVIIKLNSRLEHFSLLSHLKIMGWGLYFIISLFTAIAILIDAILHLIYSFYSCNMGDIYHAIVSSFSLSIFCRHFFNAAASIY